MSSLLTCVLLSTFFSYGYSLDCYSYICSNSSSISCSPPQAITCVRIDGFPMAPDRCMTKRIVMEASGVTLYQEIRNCSYSLFCNMRDAICNAANVTMFEYVKIKSCEVGCCKGDLCNRGGPIPTQAPRPTGPSGADLTCLACSNIPTVGVQTDCKNPIRQTCGAGIWPFIPQDRCMTVEITMRMPSTGLMKSKQKMKNCSNAVLCNQEILCLIANRSGDIKSCQFSCCYGNVCNADSIPTTAPAAPAAATPAAPTAQATPTPTAPATPAAPTAQATPTAPTAPTAQATPTAPTAQATPTLTAPATPATPAPAAPEATEARTETTETTTEATNRNSSMSPSKPATTVL